MQAKIDTLAASGFERTCIFKGEEYPNLSDAHYAFIVSAHNTAAQAKATAEKVREAGFSSYVKRAF